LPTIDFQVMGQLLSVTVTTTIVGFMEAISIARAMATRTRQRLDANQELVGQGFAISFPAFRRAMPYPVPSRVPPW